MKIVTSKVTSSGNSVIENLPRFENRHCEDSITNKDKVNVNYESEDLKNESQ